MVPTELIEELRGTWGPAPFDPEQWVLWNESLELLAQVPARLEKKVNDEGTLYPTLTRDLGSLEQVARIEAQCIERFLVDRTLETLHDVIVRITEEQPWSRKVSTLSPVQKSRLRSRLCEDLEHNLTIVLVKLGHPEVIRRLFSLH